MSRLAFAGLYLALNSLQGIVIPFFPLWLESKGLSGDQVAALLSVTFICKILSNPGVAHVADVTGRTSILMAALLGFALLMYLGYLMAPGAGTIMTIAIALGFALPPVYPLLDRVALGDGRSSGGAFGRVRLWGSIGFASGTLGMGFVIQAAGPGAILAGMLVLLSIAALIVVVSLMRTAPRIARSETRGVPIVLLFRQRALMLVLVGGALVQASNGFYYSLAGIVWHKAGLTSTSIAVLWVTGILSEVVFFLLAERVLRTIRARQLMALAGLITCVRWSILGTTADFRILLFAQLLQAFTIAGNVSGLMQSISETADPSYRSTAVAVYTTMAMGIFISMAIWLGRQFYNVAPLSGFYPMAAMCLISVLIVSAVDLRARQRSSQSPAT
jgi:PPP family 3-phenylpropionic acid transporter